MIQVLKFRIKNTCLTIIYIHITQVRNVRKKEKFLLVQHTEKLLQLALMQTKKQKTMISRRKSTNRYYAYIFIASNNVQIKFFFILFAIFQDPQPTIDELNAFYRDKIEEINKNHADTIRALRFRLKRYECRNTDDDYTLVSVFILFVCYFNYNKK